MELFSAVNPRLFSILNCPNQSIYASIIIELYTYIDELTDKNENTKENVKDKIYHILSSKALYIWDDDFASDTKARANSIYNRLKNDGWIFEEQHENFEYQVNFYDAPRRIIESLISIQNNESVPYSGIVTSIRNKLDNLNPNKDLLEIMEMIHSDIKKMSVELKRLRSNIYTYYEGIIKARENDFETLKEELTGKYQKNFFEKGYYNLKVNETYVRHRRSILRDLKAIRDDKDYLNKMAESKIDPNDKRYNSYEKANSYVISLMEESIDLFDGIRNTILQIDKKNNAYLNVLLSKINFQINRSDSLEGIINRVLEGIIKSDSFEITYHLTQCIPLTSESLSQPRKEAYRSQYSQIINALELPEKLKEDFERNMLINKEYSYEEILRLANELVKNKKSIKISELEINDYRDLMKIILMLTYSTSNDSKYCFVVLDEKIVRVGVKFNDMEIRRR